MRLTEQECLNGDEDGRKYRIIFHAPCRERNLVLQIFPWRSNDGQEGSSLFEIDYTQLTSCLL